MIFDEDDPLGASVPIQRARPRLPRDNHGCVGILIGFAFVLGVLVGIGLWRHFA
jgi:hypothetical protein